MFLFFCSSTWIVLSIGVLKKSQEAPPCTMSGRNTKFPPFKPLPLAEMNIPTVPPLPKEELLRMAAKLDIRPDQLVRQPCISLPDTPVFRAYFEWYKPISADLNFGLVLEDALEWTRQYGSDALWRITSSMQELGHPTAEVWVLICGESAASESEGSAAAPAA